MSEHRPEVYTGPNLTDHILYSCVSCEQPWPCRADLMRQNATLAAELEQTRQRVTAAATEMEQARRDIGRLRESGQNLWRCLFGDLAGFDNDEVIAGMEWEEAYKATEP